VSLQYREADEKVRLKDGPADLHGNAVHCLLYILIILYIHQGHLVLFADLVVPIDPESLFGGIAHPGTLDNAYGAIPQALEMLDDGNHNLRMGRSSAVGCYCYDQIGLECNGCLFVRKQCLKVDALQKRLGHQRCI